MTSQSKVGFIFEDVLGIYEWGGRAWNIVTSRKY